MEFTKLIKTMKQLITFLLASAFSTMSYAQWTAPVPTKTQKMATDGTPQFLYNQGAGGFFTGGNEYGTRASIGVQGDSVRFNIVTDANYNFCDYPTSKGKWLYLSCNNFDAMWIDAPNASTSETYPLTDAWNVLPQSDGSYKIVNNGYDSKYPLGVAEYYEGRMGNTRLYIYDIDQAYPVGDEYKSSFTGEFFDKWYFVDEEEYLALQPKVELYLTAHSLKSAIENANIDGIKRDMSVQKAVYNNTSSTLEELNTALNTVNAVISFYSTYNNVMSSYPASDLSSLKSICDNANASAEEIQRAEQGLLALAIQQVAGDASIDKPVSFTSSIGDASSTSMWKQAFKGVSTNGTWGTNTSSTEANGGADGTDMTPSFCEMKIASGSTISDCFITQDLKAMPAGLYKFTADIRLYREAGKVTSFKGAKMFFANDTIALQDYANVTYSGQKSILWNKDYFSVIAIVEESGDIRLGFDIHACNYNWFAFKNTSIEYYGNENVEANALALFKKSVNLMPLTEVDAQEDLIAAYNNAVDTYNATSTLKEAKKAVAAASAAMISVIDNRNAYEELLGKFDLWSQYIGEKQDLSGGEWDDFCDFIQGTDPIEGYPTPNPTIIIEGDRSLTTAEVTDYIKKVDNLYASAVAHSLLDGSDCTDMVKNASFKDGLANWTNTGGTVGGLYDFPCVERYESQVDISQVVKDVTDGLYSISCKVFERPANNGEYDEQTETVTRLFMNDFQTPVQNILVSALPTNKAINYANSFFEGSINEGYYETSGTTNVDAVVYAYGEESYIPNGMSGASYAFRAGRYTQKVYGFVDGGEMKIGLTSNGNTAHWILWSDFKLTYEGRNEEALKSAIPTMAEQLVAYTEQNFVTFPVEKAAENAADEAMQSLGSDVDGMYAALKTLAKVSRDVRKNTQAIEDFNHINEMLESVLDKDNETAHEKYNAISEQIADWISLDTPELLALIEKMYDCYSAYMDDEVFEEMLTMPSADKLVVSGTAYTAGEAGEITNSNKNGYIKMRTGNNGNTLTFSVNDHYKIVGITVEGYSNNTSDTADRSIDLIGMYIDGSSESIIDEKHTFTGGTMSQTPSTFHKDGFQAVKKVVLEFDNSKITSDDSKGKNKQIMAKVTFFYIINTGGDTAIKQTTVNVPASNAMFNIMGQQITAPKSNTIYIKNGNKYFVK